MILPKREEPAKDKDRTQRELQCPRLTVEHAWLQERAIELGDLVANTRGVHEQRPFLSSAPCALVWWGLCLCDS